MCMEGGGFVPFCKKRREEEEVEQIL
jgi:hypothetical protein